MLIYQDWLKEQNKESFILRAIAGHESTEDYQIALDADEYDKQKNVTITNYLKTMYTMSGQSVVDFTASNAKIASNFFHRLITQRASYLLGNGVFFNNPETKERLGKHFDEVMYKLAKNALKHKVSFGYWDYSELHIFKYTEFVPIWDGETSALRMGIRYWQIDSGKPKYIVLYEEDGYTKYRTAYDEDDKEFLILLQEKRAYVQQIAKTEAGGEEIVGESNYASLPIIPLWASDLRQSALVGTREAIDSYDLIRSGFANDLDDVAMIYWLIKNAGGMDEDDLARFRDRLKIQHIASITTQDGAEVQPYTQDIPYQARDAYLQGIKTQIYEDFGALDVHQVSANSTNDHLEAAYEPMDEEADEFEYEVSAFIYKLLGLLGIEDDPTYKRNKISNQTEQTQMVLSASDYLDEETVLNKLPFITVDEVEKILKQKDAEDASTFINPVERNPLNSPEMAENEQEVNDNIVR